jgi:hypothetical protein
MSQSPGTKNASPKNRNRSLIVITPSPFTSACKTLGGFEMSESATALPR